MRKLWDLLALFISIIYSLILWFTFLKGTFTLTAVLDTSLIWIAGIAIIGVGAKFVGWILDVFDTVYLKVKAKLEDED